MFLRSPAVIVGSEFLIIPSRCASCLGEKGFWCSLLLCNSCACSFLCARESNVKKADTNSFMNSQSLPLTMNRRVVSSSSSELSCDLAGLLLLILLHPSSFALLDHRQQRTETGIYDRVVPLYIWCIIIEIQLFPNIPATKRTGRTSCTVTHSIKYTR